MSGNVHVRTGAKGDGTGTRAGAPEWLQLIWESNGLDPEMFGQPELGDWWAGGTVEEYEHARVIHRGDGTVSVCGKTEHGDEILKKAAETLGIHHTEQVSVIQVTS